MTNDTDGHDDKTVIISKEQKVVPEQKTQFEDQTQVQLAATDEAVLQSTDISAVEVNSENTIPYEQSILQQSDMGEATVFGQHDTSEPTEATMFSSPDDIVDKTDATRILHPGAKAQNVIPAELGADTPPESQVVAQTSEANNATPVVGWLVVTDGPGRGDFRPIFYGNNTVGRNANQRIALNFRDNSISGEEQAYIQYNYKKREFLFIPNLAKPNILEVNEDNPSGPIPLKAYDVIRMGETTLIFIPLCGEQFEWGDINSET